MQKNLQVFISYAHEDERLLRNLEAHLAPLRNEGLISAWHDRNISAGTEWEREIDTHLNTAQIILLLVSASFLNSRYCYSIEMKRALERHTTDKAHVIPVILRPVMWEIEPLARLQALPTGAKPVTSRRWHNQDEALSDVAEGIAKVARILLRDEIPSTDEHEENTQKSDEETLATIAIQLEKRFATNGYMGDSSQPALHLISGKIPVVLSCPHAVKHPRRGHHEVAETFTGAFVMQLAALTQASGLIYARTSHEDPNHDANGEYKHQLRDLILRSQARFVLDIHGLAQTASMPIIIGTGRGSNLLEQADLLDVLKDTLKTAGFTNIVTDDPEFAASGHNTISAFTSRELHIPALQIEIHKDYRDPRRKPHEYSKMLHALSKAIKEMHSISQKQAL